ncbi:MAG: ribosomal RNA small subunit methyltransferase A [Candidatus Portnoybacteria bacterium]|nr:ribosomal RNA small subunit methyltransferase A [Candidatus Portnoybacteria bacterium]
MKNTKEKLKQYNIRPTKKLGQNFLTNKDSLNKILKAIDPKQDDTIIEIGPGLGALTKELSKKAKKIIAIEKDKRLYNVLKQNIKNKNIELINKDILEYQPPKIKYKLAGNIPYYITSPIIRKFLEEKSKPEKITLTTQKEVAQRICQQPPKTNLLAISVQFYAIPKIEAHIPKEHFSPKPKVDSAIINIKPKKQLPLKENQIKDFFKLIKIGFSSKRKTLLNNLNSKIKKEKSEIEKILKKSNIKSKVRAESLSIQDWLNLFHNI